MKTFLLTSACFIWSLTLVQAQEYKTKLTNAKDQKVTIDIDAGDIKIEGYAGDEVSIQAVSGYEAPPERAKGLKPLYYSAVDNTGIGLAVTPMNGGLKIEKASRKAVKYTIRVPRKVAILYQQLNWQSSEVAISNVDGDLEVRTNNASIDLTNVTGPIVANTTNGEIKVLFSSVSQEKPTAISTINGAIDITLPASTKSTLKLSSISGEMYTDFDLGLKNTKDGLSRVGGSHHIEGTTNGGGVDIQLKTINSNIFIRKQK